MEKPGPSVSSKNTSQRMFIGSDKINEIVNDSDSGGGNFSELSDSDTCEVNSPLVAATAITARKKNLSSQNLAEAGREHGGPFLNVQIQILSYDGKNKFRWFRNLHSPVYQE
jgi:hypothetical protein